MRGSTSSLHSTEAIRKYEMTVGAMYLSLTSLYGFHTDQRRQYILRPFYSPGESRPRRSEEYMAAPERSTGVRRRLPSSSKLDDVATSSISRPGLDTESHSLASRLWLESRLVPGTTSEYRPPGEDRPFTIANIRLAIRLIRLVGYRFLSLFIAGQEYRVGIYIMGAVSRGILPTLKRVSTLHD